MNDASDSLILDPNNASEGNLKVNDRNIAYQVSSGWSDDRPSTTFRYPGQQADFKAVQVVHEGGQLARTQTYLKDKEQGENDFKQHGVSRFYDPEGRELPPQYHWHGESMSRIEYWFTKNLDEIRQGPVAAVKALFNKNDMTLGDVLKTRDAVSMASTKGLQTATVPVNKL